MELKKANNQRTYTTKRHFEKGDKKQRKERKNKEMLDIKDFEQMSGQELLDFLEQEYDKVANGTLPSKLIVAIRQRIIALESEFKKYYKDMLDEYLVELGGKVMDDRWYQSESLEGNLRYHMVKFLPHGRDCEMLVIKKGTYNFIRIRSDIHSAQKMQTRDIPLFRFKSSFSEFLDMKRFKRDATEQLQKFIDYQEGLEQVGF